MSFSCTIIANEQIMPDGRIVPFFTVNHVKISIPKDHFKFSIQEGDLIMETVSLFQPVWQDKVLESVVKAL